MEPHGALTPLLALCTCCCHRPASRGSRPSGHLMVRAADWARAVAWLARVAGQAVRAREVLATDPASPPRACARKLSSTLVAGARAPAKG
jgi:hypothetical protein